MKSLLLLAGISLALAGCASPGQKTAWGKAGISRNDYGTDIGMCTGLASMEGKGNAANTAGGVSGKNGTSQSDAPPGTEAATGRSTPGNSSIPGGGSNIPSTSTYSGVATADFAQRAATQQRTQEMQAKRAQAEAFKSCLTERGYREFTLTPEQHAKLATFKFGGDEYHEYLYSLGTDAAVVARQAAK